MTFSEELIGRLINSEGEERKALIECASFEGDPVLKKICSLGEGFTVQDLLKNLYFKEYLVCLELSNKCAALKEIYDLKRRGETRHIGVFTKYAK